MGIKASIISPSEIMYLILVCSSKMALLIAGQSSPTTTLSLVVASSRSMAAFEAVELIARPAMPRAPIILLASASSADVAPKAFSRLESDIPAREDPS